MFSQQVSPLEDVSCSCTSLRAVGTALAAPPSAAAPAAARIVDHGRVLGAVPMALPCAAADVNRANIP